jgi:hypothetical protein
VHAGPKDYNNNVFIFRILLQQRSSISVEKWFEFTLGNLFVSENISQSQSFFFHFCIILDSG